MPGEQSDLAHVVGVGDVLLGKYRVESILGSGGMGVVVAAQHLHLRTRVAIKLLLPRAAHRRDLVARFLREARAAARIGGPHVVRVLDVDLRPDGVPVIVMEYLEGETLAARLRRAGPLGVVETVDFVLEVAEALAEAHAAGIVHRDLKPANLFLTSVGDHAPVIKVLDFGIAKSFEEGDESAITTSEAFMGSPPYMSPEQLAAPAGVDWRTDIWSLGVVLYECLAGSSPFAAAGVGQLCARILQEAPVPLSSLRADVTSRLDAVLLRCLAKDREDRYATVLDLAQELHGFGSERAARSLHHIELCRARLPRSPDPALAGSRISAAPSSETESSLTKGVGVRVSRPAPAGFRWGVVLPWVAAAALGGLLLALHYAGPARSPAPEPYPSLAVAPPTAVSPAPSALPSVSAGTPAASIVLSGAAPAVPVPAGSAKRRTPVPVKSVAPLPEDPESVYVHRK